MDSATDNSNEQFRVEVPKEYRINFNDDGIVTNLAAPEMKFDKYRETHFEYWESLGNAYKSISIETYLTNGELVELCCKLMEVDA